jgi:hypothetical protein
MWPDRRPRFRLNKRSSQRRRRRENKKKRRLKKSLKLTTKVSRSTSQNKPTTHLKKTWMKKLSPNLLPFTPMMKRAMSMRNKKSLR